MLKHSKMPTSMTPLFFAFSLYLASSLISMAVMNVGFGILCFTVLWTFFYSHHFSYKQIMHLFKLKNPMILKFFYSSLALISVCIMSLLVAWQQPLIFAKQTVPVHFSDTFKTWYFLFPFGLFPLLTVLSTKKQYLLLKIWISTASILSLLAIFQFYTGFPRAQGIPNLPERFHAILFLGHHLSTASIFIFPFFVVLSLSFSKDPQAQNIIPYPKLLSVLLGITLWLTWSRMLWIALPIGLFVWSWKKLTFYQFIGTTCILLITLIGINQIPMIHNRLWNTTGVYDRLEIWKVNQYFFSQRPLLGVGWRKAQVLVHYYFQEKYKLNAKQHFTGHAHNNLLAMLSEIGLLGTLIWLYWNYLFFKIAIQASRYKNLWGDISWGIFCSWIVLHLNGLTQVNFWEGKVLHQMMWAISLVLFCLTMNQKHSTHS